MSDMPIVVDYAALEEAASTIQTASRTIEEKLSELDGQLKKIDWEGNDRQAYLAVDRMEVQIARYPGDGAAYDRHRDAFVALPGARPNRRVTAIYYANPAWTPEAGGVLRLHDPEGPVDVAPVLDRLLVFLSERIDHEVLPTLAPRCAVTAWFRPRDPLG